MSYNAEIQSNNADLQTILDKVNALPEAGESENLDDEIAQQQSLIDTQAAQISNLLTILEGKAAGGSKTVTVVSGQMDSPLYYFREDGSQGTLSSYSSAEVVGGILIAIGLDYGLECDKQFFSISALDAVVYWLPDGGEISYW